MYCVIQEIELKNKYMFWEVSKELKVCTTTSNNVTYYHYRYSDSKFDREIKKAYKISIHQSYRENRKVKKKQVSVGTLNYYEIATNKYCIYDYISEKKLQLLNIAYDELVKLIEAKLVPIKNKIQEEYHQTEEYKTRVRHEEIIAQYMKNKKEFEKKYGNNTYDCCYDVFGTLRNEELLEQIKKQYETYNERKNNYYSSYYNKESNNYSDNNSSSSYCNKNQSNYNEEDKAKYKKVYRTLAKAYHPDVVKDDGEMMKFINELKESWGI